MCSVSSLVVPGARRASQGAVGLCSRGRGQALISPARRPSSGQSGRDPGAFSSMLKILPFPVHNGSVTGLVVLAKTLTKQHFNGSPFLGFLFPFGTTQREPFCLLSGKGIHGSLPFPLSLLPSVSFPAGRCCSRWLATPAFLPQGKVCQLTASQHFPSW